MKRRTHGTSAPSHLPLLPAPERNGGPRATGRAVPTRDEAHEAVEATRSVPADLQLNVPVSIPVVLAELTEEAVCFRGDSDGQLYVETETDGAVRTPLPGEVTEYLAAEVCDASGGPGCTTLAVINHGPALLDEIRAVLNRFVVLPSSAAEVAVTLWIAATHTLRVQEHATRLCIHSPVKRCGKSRLLEVIEALVHGALSTTSISVAALFRVIDQAGDEPPTILLDEADRLLGSRKDGDNADLIALLNNGFRRGLPTYRCSGPGLTPTAFHNFAMAAIAGIGRLPDTIEDRGVNITMRRRLPGEHISKFRLRSDLPALHALRDRVAVWAKQTVVGADYVYLPDELGDRACDAWEPLMAVADAAGGGWPRLARQAAVELSADSAADEIELSVDTRLLMDIRTVFESGCDKFVSTASLLAALGRDEDGPWAGRNFTARRLALHLEKFGIKPGRNTGNTQRGYWRRDLRDAFSRYVPPNTSKAPETACELRKRMDASNPTDALTRPLDTTRPIKAAGQTVIRTERAGQTGTSPQGASDPVEGATRTQRIDAAIVGQTDAADAATPSKPFRTADKARVEYWLKFEAERSESSSRPNGPGER